MALRAKIAAAVDKAFAKVGDLAQTVTLVTTTSQTYNFGSNSATEVTNSTTVLAIVLYAEQDPTAEVIDNPRKEVLVKEADLSNPKTFDTVVIDNIDHTILSYKVEPGLVTLLVTEA